MMATRADDGTVILWNLADLRHPRRLATLTCGQSGKAMAAVVFSPDGRSLVTGSEDGTVMIWSVADPTRAADLPAAGNYANRQIGASDTHTIVALAPDGRTLATIMGNHLVTVWDVADPSRPVRSSVLTRQTDGAGVVAFSPDLDRVAGTATDGSDAVTIWPIR